MYGCIRVIEVELTSCLVFYSCSFPLTPQCVLWYITLNPFVVHELESLMLLFIRLHEIKLKKYSFNLFKFVALSCFSCLNCNLGHDWTYSTSSVENHIYNCTQARTWAICLRTANYTKQNAVRLCENTRCEYEIFLFGKSICWFLLSMYLYSALSLCSSLVEFEEQLTLLLRKRETWYKYCEPQLLWVPCC